MHVRALKPLRDLPNQNDFQFVGIRHDDTQAQCHVMLREDGCCCIRGEAAYVELKGWVPA
jgi:hypothetical protein